MATVNERLRDFSVARQIDVLRAASTETGPLLKILADADRELEGLLLRIRDPGSVTAQRLEAIRRSVRDAFDRQGKQIREELNPFVNELTRMEVEATAGSLERAVRGVVLDVATPRAQVAVAAMRATPFEGLPMRGWISRLNQNDFNRTWNMVVRGVTIGQSTEELTRSVVGTQRLRFKDGVRDVGRRGMKTLVRTASIHAASLGREAVWEANKALISGVLWVSTLDGGTSPICQSLDGKTFPPGEGPRPPIHFNCRSVVTPIVKGADELGLPRGTRASFDGQVPEDLTYNDWLGQRSAEFQDSVLGSTKGKLFRQGGLSLDRFVATSGRPLTIDELRLRAPAAFREAGLG